jgi:serine/threonine protein kinase
VRGRDLFEYFIQEKPHEKGMKPCLAISRGLAKEISIALDRMHSMGVSHKDIKLENLVLDEDGGKQSGGILTKVPKIIDFDTCEVYRPGYKTVHVLGTDQYIAPESYAGFAAPPADMWALGVILYVFLTGTFPFHYKLFDDEVGENYTGHPRMEQIRRRIKLAKIDWHHAIWAEDPRAKDFVRRCFVTDPRRRMGVRSALQHAWIRDF